MFDLRYPAVLNAKENKLLGRLKSDDERAFQKVYRQYHPQLYSFAYKYVRCRVRAEDVVQDAFMKLWDHRQNIQSNIKGFLFTAARNRAVNKIRNRKRTKSKHRELEQIIPARTNGTADELIYSDYQVVLHTALSELPDAKRTIFELKTQTALTNQDVADRLDISVNTVKSQYYQASKFVKQYLDKHAGISIDR